MRTFGIFTAYSPNTRFAQEGLGRYLASFVKAGSKAGDVRFVIACPSWSRASLKDLFDGFKIPQDTYSFVGPDRKPIILAARDFLLSRRKRRTARKGRLSSFVAVLSTSGALHFRWVTGRILGSRNWLEFLIFGPYLLAMAIIALPLMIVMAIIALLLAVVGGAAFLVATMTPPARRYLRGKLKSRLRRPQQILRRSLRGLDRRLVASLVYRTMLQRETEAMIAEANVRLDIDAWYCPTALWPEVHGLNAPILICLPDVVLIEFPVAFAVGGEHLRLSYDAIVRTMSKPAHFVTYSDHIKWAIAVERFGISPHDIDVVKHAANDLAPHLRVTGFPDIEGTTENYKQQLIAAAISKNRGTYTQDGAKIDFPFIFYASQFRPSKNTLSLLRAYNYLLKKRYFGHKLILTGDPALFPDVADYVKKQDLRNDVVFLPGLSDAQLAACYSLADLAVNPSLSEGGMPFTFTEALSVGTPVVMGNIEVTREILTDPALAEATLFDPYDWQAVADKIEWALINRDALYQQQRAFYDAHLATRTWDDVVSEHIALLEQIATTPQTAA